MVEYRNDYEENKGLVEEKKRDAKVCGERQNEQKMKKLLKREWNFKNGQCRIIIKRNAEWRRRMNGEEKDD